MNPRAKFLEMYGPIFGPYRYAPFKYHLLLSYLWEAIIAIANGEERMPPPRFIEMHLTEKCPLDCEWCRRFVRSVPDEEASIDLGLVKHLLVELKEMSPDGFVKVSGTIGEPMAYPEIVSVLEALNASQLAWGITTNGLFLNRPGAINALLAAKYTHISYDAGKPQTFTLLKGGKPGDLERILTATRALAEAKKRTGSKMEIVASMLLHRGNVRELPELSSTLKECGVNTFEVKVPHFASSLGMSFGELDEAYRLLDKAQQADAADGYRFVRVQDFASALVKIAGQDAATTPRCYAGMLGLTATIDPHGRLQACCQYFQATLGAMGDTTSGLRAAWFGDRRREALARPPRGHCGSCSPSDAFVNGFVDYVSRAAKQDPEFIDWVEKNFVEPQWRRRCS
jgi:MoaA/NifB/PqqE/SkfB family radical SAM enzyme